MESIATDDTVVHIKGLRKSFNEREILKEVTLQIHKAENLVVLEKSGSGNSTRIKCLVGLTKPDAGEIYILGKNITDVSYHELNELRIKIGFLFQSGALYDSMMVHDHFAFPLKQQKKCGSGCSLGPDSGGTREYGTAGCRRNFPVE